MLSADAADGPLVCRAVSLACLDSLLVLDHQNRYERVKREKREEK